MAVPYGEINSITQKYFMPKLVDNIFQSNALLQRWKKNGKYETYDGGTSIMVPVAYAQTTAADWYTGTDTLNTTANDQITAAEFTMKQAYANITITRTDELNNAGKSQIVNFVKAKVEIAEKTIKDILGTGLYSDGTNAKQIVGLRSMVAASGTYGGIARASNTWWNAQVSTATALTIARLRGMIGDATIDSDKVSVHVTTQDQFDVLYGLIQPQQRFQDSETANAGFTNLMFEGKPVIVDSHVPSGYWYGLNESYLGIKAHKDEDFRFEPFQKTPEQNVSYAKIYWAGAMWGNNPRMQFVFTSLT